MTENAWKRWPSREALSRAGVVKSRRALAWAARLFALGLLLWTTFTSGHLGAWKIVAGALGVLVCGLAAWAFWRTTLEHRLLPSLALLALLLAIATVGASTGFRVPAIVLWCGCAISAIERLPLAAALPATSVALSAFAAVNNDVWLTTAATAGGSPWPDTCCASTRRPGAVPSGCSLRSGRLAWPRRSPRHWRSGPGSRGRSMTSWRTVSRHRWCIWRRPGC